jgi:CRP-like cAMP-binding protein
MKVIRDSEKIAHYLHTYQIESIFGEQLFPYLSLYRFDQGEFVCSQGDHSEILYVLVKGKVKIYTTSEEGRTIILSFKTPLEMIGDIEYIRGINIINTVEAVSSIQMIGIEYRWLKLYGRDHAPLLQFLLDIITRKLSDKSNSLSFHLFYPVEVRLASYLLSMFYDEEDSFFKGQLSTNSLMDTANLIGTSYRHLNRVIKQFCHEGLLERNKGWVVVKDLEGLRTRARENIYE